MEKQDDIHIMSGLLLPICLSVSFIYLITVIGIVNYNYVCIDTQVCIRNRDS